MAWINTIDEKEAKGELKDIYEGIKEKRGKISNIMKVHSLNPKAMKSHLDLYIDLMFGGSNLSREERELIAVVVSAANNCEYCMVHHGEALNHYWGDKKRLEESIKNFASANFPERVKKMLEYAYKLTKTPDKITREDIEILRKSDFSDKDILDINLITSYFNFVSRIASGLGVNFTSKELQGYKF
ncbi:peroxidase-related enzyme [candidate division WOR-3 bacterium]|jgi:uncharacterized peroxidase-related enzyme|nr:peroxidase-related enzyme [candidate division WOR-3 bacterium]